MSLVKGHSTLQGELWGCSSNLWRLPKREMRIWIEKAPFWVSGGHACVLICIKMTVNASISAAPKGKKKIEISEGVINWWRSPEERHTLKAITRCAARNHSGFNTWGASPVYAQIKTAQFHTVDLNYSFLFFEHCYHGLLCSSVSLRERAKSKCDILQYVIKGYKHQSGTPNKHTLAYFPPCTIFRKHTFKWDRNV